MGEKTRKVAIMGLGAAAMVCWPLFVLVVGVALVLVPNDPQAPIGSILGSMAIFGGLAFATTWMVIRLIRRERSQNGITMMPEWFIQVFGILLLLGIVVSAVLLRNIWLVGEGVAAAIAMITIRSMVRSKGT